MSSKEQKQITLSKPSQRITSSKEQKQEQIQEQEQKQEKITNQIK
jgi:hypothetical protein